MWVEMCEGSKLIYNGKICVEDGKCVKGKVYIERKCEERKCGWKGGV